MELRNEWKAFMEEDQGVGVIELVLVLVGKCITGIVRVLRVCCR